MIEWYDRVSSTNDVAMARACEGAESGLWVAARSQSSGRGRERRIWVSPVGNLYASLYLLDPTRCAKLPEIGFVAGLALVRTLRHLGGGCEDIAIKWPNDMVCRGAKLAGLLVEARAIASSNYACIVGIGVNCCYGPTNLAYPTICLSQLTGKEIFPEALLEVLDEQMGACLALYARGEQFAKICAEWLAHASGVGEPIAVTVGQETLSGIFKSIDDRGQLLLETSMGLRAITCGDVFLT